MKTLLTVYLILSVLSYPILAGWAFAYFQGKYSLIAVESKFSNAMFAYLWSVCGAAVWPAFLPIVYFAFTERARYGWQWPRFK